MSSPSFYIDSLSFADEWYAYDPKTDPKVGERQKAAEEKAKKKATQKGKRQGVVKEEGTSDSPRKELAETQALLEQIRIIIPPASDFVAVMKVYEELDDLLEFILLRKKVKKLDAVNSDLEADLIDRKDKLACCNEEVVPDLLEENRFIQGQINSLSTAEAQIVDAELKFAARMAEDERASVVEQELAAA